MATGTTLRVQQLQVPTYNHPCGDLLDGGRRREYLNIAVPLYRASITGDLEAAKRVLQSHEYVVQYSITEKKETPLHVAAAGDNTKLVSYLVNMMSKVDLELQNGDGNTAFCVAVISGNVDMVEIMFNKNRALPNICGNKNMMPLYLAAFHGKRHVVTFLYDQLLLDRTIGEHWTDDVMDEVLLKCIQAKIFDVALRILEDNIQLPQENHATDVLQLLARKPEVLDGRRVNSHMSAILGFDALLTSPPPKENGATLLLKLLWKRIIEYPKHVIDEILRGPMIEKNGNETYPFRVLFIAARMNNTKFLIELIREYPDLIWTRNDEGQTIFHIAVSHRHQDVYSLLFEFGSVKDLITPITDHEGNNILHLVGKKMKDFNASAALYQVQSESLWYKEVEDAIPPPYRDMKNVAGKTPQELFIKNHKHLVSQGIQSINDTINISMVVAALVCTIGFSVVFSVPGGFDQNTGFPIFLHNKKYVAFVALDVLSFLLSTGSIVTFLSIVLSGGKGDTESVLKRWVIGQLALLTSIITLVFAFAVGCYLLYQSISRKAMPFITYALGNVLLLTYLSVYVSLVKDAILPTFWPKYLFRLKKHTLYTIKK